MPDNRTESCQTTEKSDKPCKNCIYETAGGACHYADKAWVDTDGTKRNYPGCKKWRAWWAKQWAKVQELYGVRHDG